MRLILILLCLILCGCSHSYVIGAIKTNNYISGPYNVTDTSILGIGYVPGQYGCAVIGYNQTKVHVLNTQRLREERILLREYNLVHGK